MAEVVEAQLALVVDPVPPATRLFLVMRELEELVRMVEERRRVRRRCGEVLREAMAYRSAPEQQMDDRLDDTRLLLLQNGFIPRGLRGPLVQQAEAVEAGNATRRPRDVTRAHHASAIARDVKRTLHPDVADILLALTEEEVVEALARVKTAEQLADPDMAYEVLLETLPKYHVSRARRRLAEGASLETIVREHPEIVAELRWLRWLTMQPGRRMADLPYPNLNAAKTEAAKMIKESEKLTLAHAFALAYAAAEDVIDYRRARPTDPDGLETLTKLLADMANVGHDLWATEAEVQEAVNASVLVRRLHAGVGREVREIGNAVYHMAKLLVPERVYPTSIASAASTLGRAVHWVNNALTQFKMELRSAERRFSDREPTPVQRGEVSSLTGLMRRY